MIQTIRNAWAVPELRKKILFTIMALLIFRLGSAIPVPYIDSNALRDYMQTQSGTILGLMNAMSGSAFSMATILDRKSTRLNSSHIATSRMPSSA